MVKQSKIFSLLNTAPNMFISGIEEESETLIDDDADTCVNLTGSDGCKMDRVWNLFIMFRYKEQGTEYVLDVLFTMSRVQNIFK